MLIHMLGQWSKGNIPGRTTPDSLQERIDGALYWAQRSDDDGKPEAAEKQRARARKFQEELDALLKDSK